MQNETNTNAAPVERRIGINVIEARTATKAAMPDAIDRQFGKITAAIMSAVADAKTFVVIDDDIYPETYEALIDAGFRTSSHGCNGAVIRWDSDQHGFGLRKSNDRY